MHFSIVWISLIALLFSCNSSPTSKVDDALKHRIVLCTGPSNGRYETLKKITEQDMELIPFKKIFLATPDPKNMGIIFKNQPASCELYPDRGKQLNCLNCFILSVKMAVNDPEVLDEDIILFKQEAVYINDMNLVKKAVGKIVEGYDLVVKYWVGFDADKDSPRLNDYYHADSCFIKVSAAREIFKDHPQVEAFNHAFQFSEEYTTRFLLNRCKKIFKINYQHSSWKDNELGFYHIGRYEEIAEWYWNKKNYDEIYK